MMVSLRLWPFVALAALLFMATAYLPAADEDTPENPSKTKQALESTFTKPITEDSVKVPEGTPRQMIKLINEAEQFAQQNGLSEEESQKLEIFIALNGAKAALASKDITTEEKVDLQAKKVMALFKAQQLEAAKYLPRFKAYVAELRQEDPKSMPAARGGALVLREQIRDEKSDSKVWVAELVQYANDFPANPIAPQLFVMAGESLREQGKKEEALALYRQGVKLFAETPATQTFEGILAQLELIGKPLQLVGPTLDGSPLDFASYKGKVVLVDFWATWCSPCRAALPSLKKVYTKYHDKGLEIIGISLDNSREDLEDFVNAEKLPWTQVFFKDPAKQGWENPISRKYGISGIPTMFLVDQQGRVVETDLHGDRAIEQAVKDLLAKGSGDSAKEPSAKDSVTETPSPQESPAKEPAKEPAKNTPTD